MNADGSTSPLPSAASNRQRHTSLLGQRDGIHQVLQHDVGGTKRRLVRARSHARTEHLQRLGVGKSPAQRFRKLRCIHARSFGKAHRLGDHREETRHDDLIGKLGDLPGARFAHASEPAGKFRNQRTYELDLFRFPAGHDRQRALLRTHRPA